eukprot:EG_transcript_8111
MGCATSVTERDGGLAAPPPAQTNEFCEFWVAGSVQAGSNGVPEKGPFRDEAVPVQPAKHKILFDFTPVGPSVPADFAGISAVPPTGPLHARAFFPHCLTCYVVGWARLELSPEHPHYNSKKQREREKEKERLGVPIDHSRKKLYYIYPERVSEIGVFISVDGKKMETNVAVSSDSWDAEPIQGAFFTFSPEHGSVFGQNSMPLPIWPAQNDSLMQDKRWHRFSTEFQRLLSKLSSGSHDVKVELKFRYGNNKFTAWRGSDDDKGVYRYSDDDRSEFMVSESVATGKFQLKLTSDEIKNFKKSAEELDIDFKRRFEDKK